MLAESLVSVADDDEIQLEENYTINWKDMKEKPKENLKT